MNITQKIPRRQQGSMLLEALISILIFSIGILAIIGLQANSIKLSNDAKYRSDASLLADQYVAAMWADMASAATAASANGAPIPFNAAEFANFASGGTNFNTWYTNSVLRTLPNTNASAAVATNTVITCGNVACPLNPSNAQQNSSTTATISISWQLPGGDVHTYSTTALISAQKQI